MNIDPQEREELRLLVADSVTYFPTDWEVGRCKFRFDMEETYFQIELIRVSDTYDVVDSDYCTMILHVKGP